MTAICGYSDEELSGIALEDLLHPDDRGGTEARLQSVFGGPAARSRLEQRFAHKDGRTIWVTTTLSAIRLPDGAPTSALLMVEDTTDERLAREALNESEKFRTMGRMAAALVHEINNPLQAVLGCLGLAEESLEQGEDVTRYLQVAHEELTRTAEIVGRLRAMQQQTDPAEKEPTDLRALVKNVLTVTESRCLDQRIRVLFKSPPFLPVVQAAPERVTQLFLNLVINALDAMPRGGCLHVEMSETSAPVGIRTTLSDTGEGMDPKRIARPFEPFTSTRSSGLGLGLYISRKIVEEHGGRIDVDSTLGKGTTFAVWLPEKQG
jgi:PAS domain S-box-containing protein